MAMYMPLLNIANTRNTTKHGCMSDGRKVRGRQSIARDSFILLS